MQRDICPNPLWGSSGNSAKRQSHQVAQNHTQYNKRELQKCEAAYATSIFLPPLNLSNPQIHRQIRDIFEARPRPVLQQYAQDAYIANVGTYPPWLPKEV